MSGGTRRLIWLSKNAPNKKRTLKRTKRPCASYAAGRVSFITIGAVNTALRLATSVTAGASTLNRAMTCKDCTERRVGCHANCPKYAEEKKKRDEIRMKHREGVDADGMLVSGYIKRASQCRSWTRKNIWRYRGC